MITPLTLDDVENATDEEVIAAYIVDGLTEEEARANLSAIRGKLPPGTTID